MLYVFKVDVGHMLAFDMELVTRTVRQLKTEIDKDHDIPYRHQVLYVSGGQIMDGKVIVGKYQSGTENNPIWLVDNRCYNNQTPPVAYIRPGPEDNMEASVDKSMHLSISYETIVTRAQIATLFSQIGNEEMKICEGLVQDQHLQHQSWLALKCTLEDKGFAFEKNIKGFEKLFDDFLTHRGEALEIMQTFKSTIELINKIPVPPCLESYAAKSGEDRSQLLTESSVKLLGDKPISTLTSYIDRLETSASSGPPSGHYDSDGSSHDTSFYSDIYAGSSPASGAGLMPRYKIGGSNVSSAAGSPSIGGGYLHPQSPQHKATDLSTQRQSKSSLSKLPDSPISVSIPKQSTQENIEKAFREDKYISENKTMQLLISPTGSGQTSPKSSPPLGIHHLQSSHRTLGDWIKGNASRDPVQMVKRELEDKCAKLTPDRRDHIIDKSKKIMKSIDNKSMTEFSGFDIRLAGLETLMNDMRTHNENQALMAHGFVQNKERVRVERDQSVIPVLCESHQKQLQDMMVIHDKIGNLKLRICNSKQELCKNIHARIRWIMRMEEDLRDVNHDIVMTQGMITKLTGYIKTLRQLNSTPTLFAQGIVEGYRRRQFSQTFLTWAGSWAKENQYIYNEEIERRKEFKDNLNGHFLTRLFSGYGDEPPPFATTPPQPFDTKLPVVEEKDIVLLRRQVPEIANLLTLPDETVIGRMPLTFNSEAQTSFTQSRAHLLYADGIAPLDVDGKWSGPGETSVDIPPHSFETVLAVSPGDITQSVEVIPRAGESMEESDVMGAMQIPGAVGRAKYYDHAGPGSPQPPKSLSLHDDISYGDDSIGTGSPPFHSIRYTSLQDQHLKSLPNSPDLDEYATADFTTDFYIDESIPSAMSNSSPDRTIADLQVQLQEKNSTIDQQHEELTQVKEKLSNLDATIRSLRSGLKDLGFPHSVGRLKEDCRYLQQQAIQEKDCMQQDFKDLSESVTQLINGLGEENQLLDSTISDLKDEVETTKISHYKKLNVYRGFVADKNVAKEISDRQVQELEKINTAQLESISSLQKVNSDLDKKVDNFEIELEKQMNLVQTTAKEKQVVDELLKSEKEENYEIENQVIELEKELCSLQEKWNNLETQVSDANETISNKEKEFEINVSKLKDDHTKAIFDEQVKSYGIQSKFEDLQQSSDAKLEETVSKLNNAMAEKSELEAKLSSFNEQLQAKTNELEQEIEIGAITVNNQLLEHEVEMDKIRSELKLEIDNKDQELQTVQENAETKEKEIVKLKQQFELSKEQLTLEFQSRTDDTVKRLQEDSEEKIKQREHLVKEELTKLHEENLEQTLKEREQELTKITDEAKEECIRQQETALQELQKQHDDAIKRLEEDNEKRLVEEKTKLEELHSETLKNREQHMEKNSQEILEAVKQEQEKETNEMKETLEFDFHKRMADLTRDIAAKDSEIEHLKESVAQQQQCIAKMKDDGDIMTLQRHGEIISQMKEAWEEQQLEAVNKALGEVQVKHEEDFSNLIEKLEKQKEDSLSTMQTSLTADKQVLFNEALDKAVSDKERVIEELRTKEAMQKQAIESLTTELASVTSGEKLQQLEKDLCKAKDAEKQAVLSQRSCEQELSKLKQNMQQSVVSLGLSGMTQSLMGQSLLTQSVMPVTESSSFKDRIQQLESENKAQNDELMTLRAQFKDKLGVELPVHPVGLVRDKVSIHTFTRGDIVLLCLDEKYDHYVVFTVGPLLHFLHSDCYVALGLKPAEGEARKLWVLAELIDKEYCQARKAQNRFKVPIGTKFYRVRCHPYDFPIPPSKVKAIDQAMGGAESEKIDRSLAKHAESSISRKSEMSESSVSELEESIGLPGPQS